jgi:hypothetical protein
MSWHGFERGQRIGREAIVEACKSRLESGKVTNVPAKWSHVGVIQTCGERELVFSPQTETGWGASPLNDNNWRTIKGKPIGTAK